MSTGNAALAELLECWICLESYTRLEVLACKHSLCYSCLRWLCNRENTITCPQCSVVHDIPGGGLAGLNDSLVINNLLSLSIQMGEGRKCSDCKEGPVVSVCAHCDSQVCAPCLVQHSELSTELKITLREIKESLSPEENQEPLAEKRSKIQESMDTLKNERGRMREVFDDAIRSLVKRRNQLESYIEVVLQIHEDFIQASGGSAANASYLSTLSGKLAECRTTESLRGLRDKATDLKTTARLIRTRDDHFRFIGEARTLNLETFGGIEFGQAIVDIKAFYEVSADTSSEEEAATAGPLAGADSLLVPAREPNRPRYYQNQLPTGVNYIEKGTGSINRIHQIGNQKYENHVSMLLESPVGCTYHVATDEIYSTDCDRKRIMVYNSTGRNGREFYSGINYPLDVAISGDGKYILITGSTALHKLTLGGELVKKIETFGNGNLRFCVSLACHDHHLVLLDKYHKCVIVYTDSDQYVRHFGQGYLREPWAIAVDGNGDIYVTDRKSSCVHVFKWNGQFSETFGKLDQDDDIGGMTVDRDGFVSVSRRRSHRIDVYDPQRRLVTSFGQLGERPGDFKKPLGLCLMPDGRMIVADHENSRLQIF